MPGYMWFILAVITLLLGYIIYGKIVEKVFGVDENRPTPANTMADGVDYVVMPKWKVWLVQLLNIAGVGPVFGPILGAIYGPTALLWIVFGTIFAGGVHDYMTGMLSVRFKGSNVPNIVGITMGNFARNIMRVFALILLLLVGVVFATAPAGLLKNLTVDIFDGNLTFGVWIAIIFAYYFLATIVPIDKIIGKIYPIFGALLLIMAIGVTISLFVNKTDVFYSWIDFSEKFNPNPKDMPIFPLVFITIACGALSGFHSTQSPLMSRCLDNEKNGRFAFYGGMIAEGFIGLVWCTAGMTFYPNVQSYIAAGSPANIVNEVCTTLLGSFGGVLAVLGVIVLPITSGDTAFRAARLTIAEAINISQKERLKRLAIAIPLFAIGILLSQVDFNIIWRYFGFSNQMLAAISLWTGAVYLYKRHKFHWICTIPAAFITAATISFICFDSNLGSGLDIQIANGIGISFTLICFGAFIVLGKKATKGEDLENT